MHLQDGIMEVDKMTCKRCNEPMDPEYGKYCEGCQEDLAEAKLEMED